MFVLIFFESMNYFTIYSIILYYIYSKNNNFKYIYILGLKWIGLKVYLKEKKHKMLKWWGLRRTNFVTPEIMIRIYCWKRCSEECGDDSTLYHRRKHSCRSCKKKAWSLLIKRAIAKKVFAQGGKKKSNKTNKSKKMK